MASFIWPSSLPQKPLTSGFSEKQQSAKVRTPMDIGPAKQRRRFTKSVDQIDCVFRMDLSQTNTFEDFYKNTIGQGAEAFEIEDPRTGNTVDMRFRGTDDDYTMENLGGDIYDVTVKFEVV